MAYPHGVYRGCGRTPRPPKKSTCPITSSLTGPSHLPHPAPFLPQAGNLNHALFEYPTSGEYILLLDCDMVPRPHILHALLPHAFTSDRYLSERIGMVQSPQAFFNAPPHDPLNHQSLLFYQVRGPQDIQRSKLRVLSRTLDPVYSVISRTPSLLQPMSLRFHG